MKKKNEEMATSAFGIFRYFIFSYIAPDMREVVLQTEIWRMPKESSKNIENKKG